MKDITLYHNTNPRSRIVVSAEMKNRKFRIGYVTTFTMDQHGTWGAIIPYGLKSFSIEPTKDYEEAIRTILSMPCCAEYTRETPAEVAA